MKVHNIIDLILSILCIPFFALGLIGALFFPLIALLVIFTIGMSIFCACTRYSFVCIGGVLGGIFALKNPPSGDLWSNIFLTFPFYCALGVILWFGCVYLFSVREHIFAYFDEETEENELSPSQKIPKNIIS